MLLICTDSNVWFYMIVVYACLCYVHVVWVFYCQTTLASFPQGFVFVVSEALYPRWFDPHWHTGYGCSTHVATWPARSSEQKIGFREDHPGFANFG